MSSFGDPTEIAQRLMRANRRHRSFSALRIFASLALSGGVLFVVIGGLSDAYRPLSEWLLQSRALGKYAWMLAVVIVAAPGFLLAGMVVGRRHWWLPAVAPILLASGLFCIAAWLLSAAGYWGGFRAEAPAWLAPLAGAALLGGLVVLGSRLAVSRRGARLVGSVGALYLIGISAAGLASLLSATGVLASVAVAEAGVATIALAALWDRQGWRSAMLWVGSVALLGFLAVMIAGGRYPARALGFSSGEDLWSAIIAAETIVWGALAVIYLRHVRGHGRTGSTGRG